MLAELCLLMIVNGPEHLLSNHYLLGVDPSVVADGIGSGIRNGYVDRKRRSLKTGMGIPWYDRK